MKTVNVPLPTKRALCFFCGKKLTGKSGKWSGLNICCTRGLQILTCSEHAEMGDRLIVGVQCLCHADPKLQTNWNE